jgi:hypothetical protein
VTQAQPTETLVSYLYKKKKLRKKTISKQLVLRNIKRYRGVIPSEKYKT